MSNPASKSPNPETDAIRAAFAALKTYDQGSSRAALLPIDNAVVSTLDDSKARKELERQLVIALKNAPSVAAREYVCSKLAMIGSKSCVPALALLLTVPEAASAARAALEVIPGRHAARALRESLPKLEASQKIGAINSLGRRRDADNVRALSKLLTDPNPGIAGAAAAALGEIGVTSAAKALRAFLPRAPHTLLPQVTDACLVCAEHLLADGKRVDAEELYRLVSTTANMRHVQIAAARGLEQARRKR